MKNVGYTLLGAVLGIGLVAVIAAGGPYDPLANRAKAPANRAWLIPYIGQFYGDGTGLSNVTATATESSWTTLGSTFSNASGKAFIHLTTAMSGAAIAGTYLGYSMSLSGPSGETYVGASGLNGKVWGTGGFYGSGVGITNLYSSSIRGITNGTAPSDPANIKVWANLTLTNGAVYKIPLYQ